MHEMDNVRILHKLHIVHKLHRQHKFAIKHILAELHPGFSFEQCFDLNFGLDGEPWMNRS